MKQLLVLTLLPVVLFALEKVNLVKNPSFEVEDKYWQTYTGTRPYIENDSALADAHAAEITFTGLFSALANTSSMPGDPTPPPDMRDSAVVIQGLIAGKSLKDLDSLYWVMKVTPPEIGFHRECLVFIGFILQAGKPDFVWAVYNYYNPTFGPWGDASDREVINFELTDDSSWIKYQRDVYNDWILTKGLSLDLLLDSIALVGYGLINGGWFGQKVYWDDIRLTGYADYDVGVKEILSGDSVWAGVYYKPVARIKNFGRQAADDFLAIAEIWQGETLVWADTIPYTLPGDTEDTLEFDSFPVPNAASYTLTVRTEMEPDESDEDDAISKTLYGTAIAENPESQSVTLEVQSFTANPRVVYSLPAGQSGTISIYDAVGRKIESKVVIGSGDVEFPSALSAGVYFVKLETEKTTLTRKAIVLK